jgi:hypothetical protein
MDKYIIIAIVISAPIAVALIGIGYLAEAVYELTRR